MSGQGGLLSWLPAPDAKLLAQAKARGFALGNGETASLNEIQFNLRDPTDVTRPHPILGDPTVRRALLSGIDVAAALASWNVAGLYGVRRTTSPADLEPDYACHIPPIAFDPAAAGRLLDAAGWTPDYGGIREKSGRRLHLRLGFYTGADVDFSANVAALRAQLRRLGVDADIQAVDQSLLFSDWVSGSPLFTGDFDIMFYDWQPDLAGIEHDFDSFFASSNVPSAENPGGRNVNGIADPMIDAWLKQARTNLDLRTRRDLYCRVAERVQNGLYAQEYTAAVPNWPISAASLRGWLQAERYTWFGQDAEDWYLRP
jgi:peptide/nickel transport system substrate-binding protein